MSGKERRPQMRILSIRKAEASAKANETFAVAPVKIGISPERMRAREKAAVHIGKLLIL